MELALGENNVMLSRFFIDNSGWFFYDEGEMKKRLINLLFPLLCGLMCFLLFNIFYHPEVDSPDMTTAILSFFAGLVCSAQVLLSDRKSAALTAYSWIGITIPILLIEVFRPTPVDLLMHRVLYMAMLIGTFINWFYLICWRFDTSSKKPDHPSH